MHQGIQVVDIIPLHDQLNFPSQVSQIRFLSQIPVRFVLDSAAAKFQSMVTSFTKIDVILTKD